MARVTKTKTTEVQTETQPTLTWAESMESTTSNEEKPQFDVTEQDTDQEKFESAQDLLESIYEQRRIIREAESNVTRLLKKLTVRVRKDSRRLRRDRGEKKVARNQKKRPITDALAQLIGVDKGTEMTRGDVQSVICKYVKEHGLRCEDDKKCFSTDEALEKVIGKPRFPAHTKNQDLRHSFNNLMNVLGDCFVPES